MYGRRVIEEYLRSPHAAIKPARIRLLASLPEAVRKRLGDWAPKTPIDLLDARQLDELCEKNHQGIVFQFEAHSFPGLQAKKPAEVLSTAKGPLLLLDRIQDAGNLGAILRTAEVYGFRSVFLSHQCAPISAAVHRASSGASLHLQIYQSGNLQQFCKSTRKAGFWLCGAIAPSDLERKPNSGQLANRTLLQHDQLQALPPTDQIVLLIGSEGEGLRDLALRNCDFLLTIQLSGQTTSLNAAVAAGILMDRLRFRSLP
ncbi:MAG: RNA methyltransferase [Leptospiraceae bacterium]|nr:RNA methyltransferase [Leptospiraceae bacterium]